MGEGYNRVLLLGNLGADPELKMTQEDRVLALRRRFHGAWVRMQRDAGKGVPAGAEWNAMRDEMHGAVLALADDSVRAVSEAWRAEHLERTGVASEDCDPRTCPYGGES